MEPSTSDRPASASNQSLLNVLVGAKVQLQEICMIPKSHTGEIINLASTAIEHFAERLKSLVSEEDKIIIEREKNVSLSTCETVARSSIPHLFDTTEQAGYVSPLSHPSLKMYYVSIKKVICTMLEDPFLLNLVLNPPKKSFDGIIRDIWDAEKSLIMRDAFKNSDADGFVSISLYADGFEVVNPIGSRKGKYEMIGLYWFIQNFPPEFRSRREFIQLFSVFSKHIVQDHNYAQVMSPLIDEIRDDPYVSFNKNGQVYRIIIFVSSFVCDNLGAHQFGGFSNSFNSRKCCRHCEASKYNTDWPICASAKKRNKYNYNHQLRVVTENPNFARYYGITRPSVLNKLPTFHCIDDIPFDFAHDLLEGVVGYVLKQVLNAELKAGVSLVEINSRISELLYHVCDDKPSFITKTKSAEIKLSQSASQSWTLLRILPCILSDLVDVKKFTWKIVFLLQRIVCTIASRSFSHRDIDNLSADINTFLVKCEELFEGVKLPPKFHFLTHYPANIRRFGPPYTFWTLRLESKHSYFKSLVRKTKNFKYLSKSLCERHQTLQAVKHLSHSQKNVVKHIGRRKKLSVPPEFKDILPNSPVSSLSRVVLEGESINQFTAIRSEGNIFAVKYIYLSPENNVLLCCQKIDVSGHLNIIKYLPSFSVVTKFDELSFFPFYSVNSVSFICPMRGQINPGEP